MRHSHGEIGVALSDLLSDWRQLKKKAASRMGSALASHMRDAFWHNYLTTSLAWYVATRPPPSRLPTALKGRGLLVQGLFVFWAVSFLSQNGSHQAMVGRPKGDCAFLGFDFAACMFRQLCRRCQGLSAGGIQESSVLGEQQGAAREARLALLFSCVDIWGGPVASREVWGTSQGVWGTSGLLLKIHSKKSSGEVAWELLGKLGDVLGIPGTFQKFWRSPTPSLQHAKNSLQENQTEQVVVL